MSCSAAPRLGRGQRGHRTNDTRRDRPIFSVDLPICLLAFALILPLLERREGEAKAHTAQCRAFVHAFKFTHKHICMHCFLMCVCSSLSLYFIPSFPLLHRTPAPVSSHNVICVKVAPFSSLIAHLSFFSTPKSVSLLSLSGTGEKNGKRKGNTTRYWGSNRRRESQLRLQERKRVGDLSRGKA